MAVFPRKLKRDLLIDGGLEVTGNSTLTGAVTAAGGVGITGSLAASAVAGALVCASGGYMSDYVQSLTAADCERTGTTGTRILGYGITKVTLTKAAATGAANFQLVLAGPVKAGAHKYLVLTRATGASTFEVWISNLTSALTFYGSTADAIKLTTDWVSPNPAGFHFVGITTAQWAALSVNGLQSTQWSYTVSTFSAT